MKDLPSKITESTEEGNEKYSSDLSEPDDEGVDDQIYSDDGFEEISDTVSIHTP